MDTRTGHVVEDITDLPKEMRRHYTRLPDGPPAEAARRELAGRPEVTVPLGGNNELAKFARKDRNKRKRQSAKASRKKNRK